MLGVDVDKITAPFVEAMNGISERLDTVIALLEDVSSKLDNN